MNQFPREFWRDVGLSTMTANALVDAGITDWDQLLSRSDYQIKCIPNIGKLGFDAIKVAIMQHKGEDMPASNGTDPLREKALTLAIDACQNRPHEDIVEVAAKFHAFLAGREGA